MPVQPESWRYRTRFGTFVIRRRAEDGRFLLKIDVSGDVETLGSYHSPQAAADDVYMCATGFAPWDSLVTVDQPTDLSEWKARYPRGRA